MTKSSGWRELFTTNGLAVLVFVGGIALQALETFIASAMLPTIVRDIGGLDLFAWNTTIFIVASILATVFAATRPPRFDTRATYLLAAAAFGVGSMVCGLAPSMQGLLVGRAIQGFGAGLMIAMTYAMMRVVFPQHLWPRAMALNSTVWGVATLLGPAVGGIFAEYDLWRWAFLSIVPFAALLGVGVWRLLPADENPRPAEAAPVIQITLVATAILSISIASLQTDRTDLAVALLLLAVLAIILLGVAEFANQDPPPSNGRIVARHAHGQHVRHDLLLGLSISSDIFAPLFYQRLHGLSPLWAGYVSALVAIGWSISSFITSGWTGLRVRRAIAIAPLILAASTLVMFVTLARYNPTGDLVPIVASGLSLFALGAGIGMAFQHLSTAVLAGAAPADSNRASAGLGMVQLFASGLGAAIGGVVVNAAGLPRATEGAAVQAPAEWLFAVFAALCALTIPVALRAAGQRGRTPSIPR